MNPSLTVKKTKVKPIITAKQLHVKLSTGQTREKAILLIFIFYSSSPLFKTKIHTVPNPDKVSSKAQPRKQRKTCTFILYNFHPIPKENLSIIANTKISKLFRFINTFR